MKIKQAFASIRKHSRIARMARNHTVLFSLMVIAMALMLQSQTGGCCSTPNPPSQTPTAIGTLYLPRLQPPNPLWDNPNCNSTPFYQQTLPNGTIMYPLDADIASQITFYFKVRVTTIDGCYIQNTYLNKNNRVALSGKGIKVNYPTTTPYIVEVWAQEDGTFFSCSNTVPGASPEWYCKFANNENGQQIFGEGTSGNPYNLTFHPFVVANIVFAHNNGGNVSGAVEPKFKYNGNVPFGTNVLN